MQYTPYRSVLYMPGSNARALEKARALAADALILDLEDAVASDLKPTARRMVAQALSAGGFGHKTLIVRINGADTPWGAEDLKAAIAARPDAILLPKVESAEQIAAHTRALPDGSNIPFWAMMETPRGILNAAQIAAAPNLSGFVMGTNDLVKELGAAHTPDRAPLIASLSHCLLAARAGGLVCIDGVYNAFKDEEGLRQACQQGRDMGFDGKTLIHPAQIDIANQVFAPAAEDIALARRQVAAFAEAELRGEGVAVVDGRIVENLHIETAKRTLAQAEAIARVSAN